MASKLGITRVEKIDGTVCLVPNGFYDPCGTMCGDVDISEDSYTPTNKPVTCHMCKSDFEKLRHGLKIVGI